MKRIMTLSIAAVIGLSATILSMTTPAHAEDTLNLFGEIKGFSDKESIDAYITFRDAETGEFLHRDRSTLDIDGNRYLAKVETGPLEGDRLYEVEVEGLAAEDSFTLVNYVELQSGSPGTPQTGHLNISGYAMASRVGVGAFPSLAKLQVNETGSLQGIRAVSESGVSVYGQNNALAGLASGGYFSTWSVGGRAVVGDAFATTGSTVGGLFYNRSSAGVAIWGRHINNTGNSIGVYGETQSADGTAIVAVNSGNGSEVELAGVNGSLVTHGEFPKHEYSTGSAAISVPIAYGSISSGGAITHGSGNFLVTQPSTGIYEIDVQGMDFDLEDSVVLVTAKNSVLGILTTVGSAASGGDFRVRTTSLLTTLLSNSDFSFVVFRNNSADSPAAGAKLPAGMSLDQLAESDPRAYRAHLRSLQDHQKSVTRLIDLELPKDEAEEQTFQPSLRQ